ncbi:unnamed protein product [Clavelina lepadiformis]|uniref:Rab3 GTPase-activating protein non-catalytic subunit n=1 Tax=Clavelina lepadiformis TaxID=159417 RepID=A0ABP0H017_CLALP
MYKRSDADEWTDTGWEENFDFDNIENMEQKANDDKNWISNCCVGISPTTDFVCFAHKDKAVFYSADAATQNLKSGDFSNLTVCFQGVLAENDGEVITNVLCLPLMSLKQSSHGSRDWICVLVGFSSGYVRMYTDKGDMLISELLHDTPVIQFSCHTFDVSFNQSMSIGRHDELTILYENCLVAIDGLSLFHTLRSCRSQLAMAAAHGMKVDDPPPLSYKKWILRGQERIQAHVGTGVSTSSTFDQLKSNSITKGFGSDSKCGKSSVYPYIAVGSGPFIGFYYAVEGNTQPFLSHVAHVVADKFKSALFNATSGFFSWGQSTSVSDPTTGNRKKKVEPGSYLDIHSGLPDSQRAVKNIVLAPGSNWLVATADSFGRVMLVNINETSVLRMWKGYRDAQIGFVRVKDEDSDYENADGSHKPRKSALFLVIYAPRRGILEIWSCINGPRVGTFNIGKNAKLLFPGFGMFGVISSKQKMISHPYTVQCCVLEADGHVKDISIPFHLALSDAKSNKARDIHHLKKVTQMLQNGLSTNDGDKVIGLIMDMRLPTVQKQAVEKLLLSKNVEMFIVENCLRKLTEQLKLREMKREEKSFSEYLHTQIVLIDLFKSFLEMNLDHDDVPVDNTSAAAFSDDLMKLLKISHSDAKRSCELISSFEKAFQDPTAVNVNYAEKVKPIEVLDFLRSFSFDRNVSRYKFIVGPKMKPTLLGHFIFHKSLFGVSLPSDVINNIQKFIKVDKKDILQLLLDYWLASSSDVTHNLVESVRNLEQFFEMLISPCGDDDDYVGGDGISTWWQWLKNEVCMPSKHIVPAYLVSLVVRAVAIKPTLNKTAINNQADASLTTVEEKGTESHSEYTEQFESGSGWETLWPELEQWNLLVKQLEDCILINTALVLAHRMKSTVNKDEDFQAVSVFELLHNGPGYVPELVAEQICSLQMAPSLIASGNALKENMEDQSTELPSYFHDFLQNTLQPQLPVSLSHNSLYAHCFWEEMLLWNKDPEDTSHLTNAISYLSFISQDPPLQSGLALMAWHTFISKRFVALAKLVNKVGKAPKDRLCRKDVGLCATSMSNFCYCCTQLLQTVANASSNSLATPNQDLEQWADENWVDVTGKESIVDLGKHQLTANMYLLQLFMDLAFVLNAVMEFSLRGVKPLTALFDANQHKMFFMDLTTVRISQSEIVDPFIIQHREDFLFKLVTAAVKLLKEKECDDDLCLPHDPIVWAEASIHLAERLGTDRRKIQSHYLHELFQHGLDELGRSMFYVLEFNEDLQSDLLAIIGKRLAYQMSIISPDRNVLLVSHMSTTLTSWLRNQTPVEMYHGHVSMRETVLTLGELIRTMSENHSLFTLSNMLYEALTLLVDVDVAEDE